MSNIQVVSQMQFGDTNALHDFALAHRFAHAQIDAKIAALGGGAMPDVALDSDAAIAVWAAAMQGESVDADPLNDWLQLHGALHQAEYSALGLGYAPDLTTVDFRSQGQFYNWMFSHSIVHDTLDTRLGIS